MEKRGGRRREAFHVSDRLHSSLFSFRVSLRALEHFLTRKRFIVYLPGGRALPRCSLEKEKKNIETCVWHGRVETNRLGAVCLLPTYILRSRLFRYYSFSTSFLSGPRYPQRLHVPRVTNLPISFGAVVYGAGTATGGRAVSLLNLRGR